ncbi:hypothetical protein, partial [uncultured Nostoc sp.]
MGDLLRMELVNYPTLIAKSNIVWASSFIDSRLYRCLATPFWSYTLSTGSSARACFQTRYILEKRRSL